MLYYNYRPIGCQVFFMSFPAKPFPSGTQKSRERFGAPGILCNLFGYTSGRNDQMMFRVTLSVDFRLL